ncbi:hypothetical protein B2G71_21180 [Novosphingobium sp. PC22D]|uniref:acyltransferase family protein n=1 Tax=Novosphingobium sp. PC22D TaxID=1962403 RepID=UPI000BEF2C56|nr:acyltransferase [Novosphingobium sp. PC22D]PEQ10695.1 hypothetical protein B2G71_21180 [Novosphingobium sp. PC22D]
MSARAETAGKPGHFDALTGIRGVAAWLVVFYHIRATLTGIVPEGVIAVFARGYLAVDLFFVLSGFVMWYNYAGRLADGRGLAVRDFFWRRFARIWPLHAAILLAFVGFAVLLLATGRPVEGMPFAELPLHVLLIQNWGFTSALTWNDPAWSISTETGAYLVFPLLVLGLSRRPSGLAVPVIAALALLAAIAGLFALTGHASLGADIPRLGLARCVLEFSLGTVCCILWQGLGEKRGAARLIGLAALAILCAGLGFALPEPLFVPAFFAALVLWLALGAGAAGRLLSASALVYLGEISYATYLAHVLLFRLFKIAFVDDTLQLGWAGIAGFVLALAVVSAALYHGLEKPAQRWLLRHRRWPRAQPAATPAE